MKKGYGSEAKCSGNNKWIGNLELESKKRMMGIDEDVMMMETRGKAI